MFFIPLCYCLAENGLLFSPYARKYLYSDRSNISLRDQGTVFTLRETQNGVIIESIKGNLDVNNFELVQSSDEKVFYLLKMPNNLVKLMVGDSCAEVVGDKILEKTCLEYEKAPGQFFKWLGTVEDLKDVFDKYLPLVKEFVAKNSSNLAKMTKKLKNIHVPYKDKVYNKSGDPRHWDDGFNHEESFDSCNSCSDDGGLGKGGDYGKNRKRGGHNGPENRGYPSHVPYKNKVYNLSRDPRYWYDGYDHEESFDSCNSCSDDGNRVVRGGKHGPTRKNTYPDTHGGGYPIPRGGNSGHYGPENRGHPNHVPYKNKVYNLNNDPRQWYDGYDHEESFDSCNSCSDDYEGNKNNGPEGGNPGYGNVKSGAKYSQNMDSSKKHPYHGAKGNKKYNRNKNNGKNSVEDLLKHGVTANMSPEDINQFLKNSNAVPIIIPMPKEFQDMGKSGSLGEKDKGDLLARNLDKSKPGNCDGDTNNKLLSDDERREMEEKRRKNKEKAEQEKCKTLLKKKENSEEERKKREEEINRKDNCSNTPKKPYFDKDFENELTKREDLGDIDFKYKRSSIDINPNSKRGVNNFKRNPCDAIKAIADMCGERDLSSKFSGMTNSLKRNRMPGFEIASHKIEPEFKTEIEKNDFEFDDIYNKYKNIVSEIYV